MKTIFTLFLSLFLSISLFAADARPKSTLVIRSADRGDIRVIIDGRRFEPNDNYLRIRSMQSGYHNVKIYRERNNGRFGIFGSRYEVVFNSSVSIRPRADVTINIDRFGRATVDEGRTNGFGYGNNGYGNNGYGDRDRTDKGYNDDKNWDKDHDFDYDRSNNSGDYDSRDSKWDDRDNPSRDDRDNRNNDNRDYNNNGYSQAMSDMDFSRVMESIQKEWFENNKMKSASQIISSNFFTTAQVKQMLQLFSFENNKLDLAKQAYGKTVDQRNYYVINDVFSFSSSKDELANYIRNFR
jgi:hypothetical protein